MASKKQSMFKNFRHDQYICIGQRSLACSMMLASLLSLSWTMNCLASSLPPTENINAHTAAKGTNTVQAPGLKSIWQMANPVKKLAQTNKEASAAIENSKTAPADSAESKDTNEKKTGSASIQDGKPAASEEQEGKSDKKKLAKPRVLPMISWYPDNGEVKAVILCVHGLGLNSDSYEEFGQKFRNRGYLIYSMDVPGFGSFKQADEGRDRVDFPYCLNAIQKSLELIHRANPDKPVFVLGESMGGAIALRATSMNPQLVDGLISSVPSGDRFKQSKETLRIGLKLLTAPNKEFDIGTSVIERATTSEALKEKWAGDPLNRMNLTPKELLTFQSFMNANYDSAKQITKTPVLFVQGCKDQLVRPEGTVQLFNSLQTKDREIELIHDKEHLIFEEGQFDDHVLDIVDKWLVAHISNNKQLTSNK
jgi:alpha-beta hydrolase superfamily lysophospholipase